MKSKTIILSNEKEKGRGILTIFQEDGLLQCRIRLYNLNRLNRYCKLGIYHNNQVFSANLLEKNGVYLSSMVGDFNIDNDFFSAIIDTQNNNNVIISGGTYSGYFLNDESVFEKDFPNKNVFNHIEKENPNTNLFDYDNDYDYNQDIDPSTPLRMTAKDACHTADSLRMTDDSLSMNQKLNTPQNEGFEGNAQKLLNNEVCEFPEQTIKESKLRACLGNSQIDLQGSQRSKLSASHGMKQKSGFPQNEGFEGNAQKLLNNEVCEFPEQTIKESKLRACCDTCIYKQFFYSQNNPNINQSNNQDKEPAPSLRTTENSVEITKDPLETKDSPLNNQENKQKSIKKALIPQFQYVFENYPKDELLCNLIPNSKFVKIEENNNSYSIGAIYNEDEMKYICYATLCDYNQPAPQELGEHFQWLPIDKEDPLSEGYYIVFQDAQDLKIVEM